MNLDFYLDFVAVDFDLEFPPNLFRNTDFDRVPTRPQLHFRSTGEGLAEGDESVGDFLP